MESILCKGADAVRAARGGAAPAPADEVLVRVKPAGVRLGCAVRPGGQPRLARASVTSCPARVVQAGSACKATSPATGVLVENSTVCGVCEQCKRGNV